MNEFALADMANTPHAADFGVKHEAVECKPTPSLLLGAKRKGAFGNAPFSDDESRAIRQRLNSGLTRGDTMQRPGPGGMPITYLEGWKAIHEANQIFGFNGWSSEILQLDQRYLEETRGRFNVCVTATVRITLRDGCRREDRGGGVAENMRSKGDAILKAEKEAVTDATKRALKNFGLRLGLSLYDRQHVREMNRPSPRESASANSGGARVGVSTANQPRFSPKQHAQSAAMATTAYRKAQTTNGMVDRANGANMMEQKFSKAVPPSGGRDQAQAPAVQAQAPSVQAQAQALLQNKMQRVRSNQEMRSVSEALATLQKQERARVSMSNMAQQLNVVPANFGGAHQPNGGANAFSAAMVDPRISGRLAQGNAVSSTSSARNMNVEGAFGTAKAVYGAGTGVMANGQSGSCVGRRRAPSGGGAQNASINLGVTIGVDNGQAISLQTSGAAGVGMKQSEIDALIAMSEFE